MTESKNNKKKSPKRLNDEQRKLVEKNIRLANFLASQTYRRLKGRLNYEDIESAAHFGLVQAALRFDPTRKDIRKEDLENGRAFSGYARLRINGSIMDYQRSLDHVPRDTRTLYNQAYPLVERHGTKKAAEKLLVEESEIISAYKLIENKPVSLNDTDSDGEGEVYASKLADPHSVQPESVLSASHILEDIADGLRNMSKAHQIVFAYRIYRKETLTKTAEAANITTSEVRKYIADIQDMARNVIMRDAGI